MNSTSDIILELKEVTKRYDNNLALSNINASFRKGTITSIYGPNGAGKSTLVKIICGVETDYSGSVIFQSKSIKPKNYAQAIQQGISYVPQDHGLLMNLTGIENLGIVQNTKTRKFWIDKQEIRKRTSEISQSLPIPNLTAIVKDLSVFEQQILAIHKALLLDSELIIFDESTTNLNRDQFSLFVKTVKNLQDRGKTIIFISHRLEEVYSVSDQVLILREGEVIKQDSLDNTPRDSIVRLFTNVNGIYTSQELTKKEKIKLCNLALDHQTIEKTIINIYQGDVLSIDTGDTPLNHYLGYQAFDSLLKYKGIRVSIVPALRNQEGIFKNLTVKDNLDIRKTKETIISQKNSDSSFDEIAKRLKLKFTSWDQNIMELSGGNKQKVIFGRGIISNADILILIEPTAGIDLQSKQIIYQMIHELKQKGKAFILITSDEAERQSLQTHSIEITRSLC